MIQSHQPSRLTWPLLAVGLAFLLCGIPVVHGQSAEDFDGDGLLNVEEESIGANPFDADTDDDGLADGNEPGEDVFADADLDGIINILDPDSDNDGLLDGLEAGVTEPVPGGEGFSGTDVQRWSPDLDPSCVTDPENPDSDSDGLRDGEEDTNGNGRVDAGETDPCQDESQQGDGILKDGFEALNGQAN